MNNSRFELYLVGMGCLILMSCNETDSPSSSLDNGSSQADVYCASDNPEYASQVISAGDCNIDYCVAYGLVTNAASSTAAVNQAVTLCRNKGGTNCSSAGAFNNGCAAVAFGSSDNATSVYTSGGETTSEARTAALNYCRSDGSSNCYIDAVQCLDN